MYTCTVYLSLLQYRSKGLQHCKHGRKARVLHAYYMQFPCGSHSVSTQLTCNYTKMRVITHDCTFTRFSTHDIACKITHSLSTGTH